MELLTEHRKKDLLILSKKEEVQYIIYDMKTKKFKDFKDINEINNKFFEKNNNYQVSNKILIFIKEMAIENSTNTIKIIEAIKNSSFSVSKLVEEDLIKFIKSHPLYNFIDKENMIVENIQKAMKKEKTTQAQKYYNNILRRLIFTRIDIFEKNKIEKAQIFEKAIKRRDKILKEKPINTLEKEFNKHNDIFL